MRAGALGHAGAVAALMLLLLRGAVAASDAQIAAPDVACTPGEEAGVAARLLRGGVTGMFKPGVQGEILEFVDSDGDLLGSRLTDASGYARASCRCEAGEEDACTVTVRLGPGPRFRAAPEEVLVRPIPARAPVLFVHVEGGLVARNPQALLPEPLEKTAAATGAAERLAALETCQTLVYLSTSPWELCSRIKRWLRERGFPRGPVLLLNPSDDPLPSRLSLERLRALAGQDRGAARAAGRLVTSETDLAQRAAEAGLPAYLLPEDGREKSTQAPQAPEEEAATVSAVTGWNDLPLACGGENGDATPARAASP